MTRLIALCLSGACLLAARAFAGDEDSSGQQVHVMGYGSNVQPQSTPLPAQTAGMGGNMQPDPSQNSGPVAGFDATSPATPAAAPAQSPAQGAAKVQPTAPADANDIYRSARYKTGDGGSSWSPTTTSAQGHGASATLGDVKETLPSLIEAFVDLHGKNGLLPLKIGSKGPARALRFASVDHGTEKVLGRGRYSAVAIFRDENGHSFKARADADCSGSDWKVTRISAIPVVKRRRQ